MSDMNKPHVAILDYGLGNILCIERAFAFCGANVTVLEKPQPLDAFSHFVLPGVGAFQAGMHNLKKQHYLDCIYDGIKKDKPLMGICLGMQLLFESSTEGGLLDGLHILPGKIEHLPEYNHQNERIKLPHIGWNQLHIANPTSSITKTLSDRDFVYFDHTYFAVLESDALLAAQTEHQSIAIPAMIQHNHIVGCQFHPEKSGKVGLTIIRNFLSL